MPKNAFLGCRLRLRYAKEEWNPDGQRDNEGGLIGGQCRIWVNVDVDGENLDNYLKENPHFGTAR